MQRPRASRVIELRTLSGYVCPHCWSALRHSCRLLSTGQPQAAARMGRTLNEAMQPLAPYCGMWEGKSNGKDRALACRLSVEDTIPETVARHVKKVMAERGRSSYDASCMRGSSRKQELGHPIGECHHVTAIYWAQETAYVYTNVLEYLFNVCQVVEQRLSAWK